MIKTSIVSCKARIEFERLKQLTVLYCKILDTIMCGDDCCCCLLLKIITYTCGIRGPMKEWAAKGCLQPWQLGRGLAPWGSSMLTWNWT
jgi:hypothetical protein